jgi:hypothetical protein
LFDSLISFVYVGVVIGISVLIFVFRLVVSRYSRVTCTSRSVIIVIGIITGRVIVIRVSIV